MPSRRLANIRAYGYLGIGTLALVCTLRWTARAEEHQDIVQHFKYGSIGAEERAGIPYWIWVALPRAFPDLLPAKPGNGYERFGFVYEAGMRRPIGISLREGTVPLAGLNCAACHAGTVRDTPGEPPRVVPGMPSHQVDLQAYQKFLFACFRDARFEPNPMWAAMRQESPSLSWFDGLLYRLIVIPRTKRIAGDLEKESTWTETRPARGPGRVDTFNPYKAMFGLDLTKDLTVGTADLPSLWNQSMREGMWLHWDGNNNLVTERNKSAAIGAGCSEDSLDLASMKRIEDWIWTLPAPALPRDRIRAERLTAGAELYKKACAECHDRSGSRTGKVVPLGEIGTDPERLNSFTPELAVKMNTLGTGKPWKFTHFRKTDGYAAMPLDGVWLRAPYLHNGSVPTLRHLLEPPERRPQVFWRGFDVYDYADGGFVWDGPDASRAGFRFDTSQKGNGHGGHLYGVNLKPAEKQDLLEYLKSL